VSYDLMAVPSPSSPSAPSASKNELRDVLKAERQRFAASLAPETRAALERQLAEVLEPLLFACRVVAAYQPMRDEISPLPALARAAELGKVTALPAFAGRDSRMTFRAGEATEPGPWGLLQPPLDQPPLAPDLVLVPLVGCDRQGNRIGMGKGHYDRTLAGLRNGARLVGLGWSFQLVREPLAPDPWDQKLHAFASPDGLTEFEP
jgi:5-formyltetrahydrofolate cyclo-ligase